MPRASWLLVRVWVCRLGVCAQPCMCRRVCVQSYVRIQVCVRVWANVSVCMHVSVPG